MPTLPIKFEDSFNILFALCIASIKKTTIRRKNTFGTQTSLYVNSVFSDHRIDILFEEKYSEIKKAQGITDDHIKAALGHAYNKTDATDNLGLCPEHYFYLLEICNQTKPNSTISIDALTQTIPSGKFKGISFFFNCTCISSCLL
jgi:hypothetical protein